ncbi:hypothetical protein NMY22_g11935 [Coprinellus aureogranulatus]|nr:hypothetical protein NMY22_g11935 [Coprinellus aureogranulatus]
MTKETRGRGKLKPKTRPQSSYRPAAGRTIVHRQNTSTEPDIGAAPSTQRYSRVRLPSNPPLLTPLALAEVDGYDSTMGGCDSRFAPKTYRIAKQGSRRAGSRYLPRQP